MNIFVLIPAGGSGLRLGASEKKQFLSLNGETILWHTLKKFLSLSQVVQVVVAVPVSDLDHPSLTEDLRLTYVAGGKTRSESVFKAFSALKGCREKDIILIHDAARPLVSPKIIEDVASMTLIRGAAIPILPVADTMKKIAGDGAVLETVARKELYSVQTPQGFHYELLAQAYKKLPFWDARFTDESMLLESIGHTVYTVPGEAQNFKITTALDLKLAEVCLQNTL